MFKKKHFMSLKKFSYLNKKQLTSTQKRRSHFHQIKISIYVYVD